MVLCCELYTKDYNFATLFLGKKTSVLGEKWSVYAPWTISDYGNKPSRDLRTGCFHTHENFFRNRIKSHWNQIVFTIFRLIWNQTDVRLVPNQSENGKYNLILVWFNKISLFPARSFMPPNEATDEPRRAILITETVSAVITSKGITTAMGYDTFVESTFVYRTLV